MRTTLILTALLAFSIGLPLLAFQAGEESKLFCLPHEQQTQLRCHCLAMGGYMNCDKNGRYSYQSWIGKGGEKISPKCAHSCHEEFCQCCQHLKNYSRAVEELRRKAREKAKQKERK